MCHLHLSIACIYRGMKWNKNKTRILYHHVTIHCKKTYWNLSKIVKKYFKLEDSCSQHVFTVLSRFYEILGLLEDIQMNSTRPLVHQLIFYLIYFEFIWIKIKINRNKNHGKVWMDLEVPKNVTTTFELQKLGPLVQNFKLGHFRFHAFA